MNNNWEIKISGEILDVRDGTHDTPKYVNDVCYPLITSKNLRNGDIDFTNVKYISKEDFDFISKRSRVDVGDVLFAMIGTIGNPVVVKNQPKYAIKNVGLFKNNRSVIASEYLKYFLESPLFLKQVDERKLLKGTTQKFIPLGNLRNIEIPVPNICLQQKIVSKIEELFSELDKTVEELKKTQQQLIVYRQAVLKSAFESIEKRREILVEECCSHIVDCLHSTAKFSPRGFYCIDTTCIANGKILFDKVRYVNEETFNQRISRLKPEHGDVLFSREGTVGTTLIVPPNVDLCLGQRMMMFRLKDSLDSKYFMYFFQSPLFKEQYKPLIMGTTAPHLNIRDIKKFRIVVCSFEQQQEIIQLIESRLSVCDKIEETINDSLKQAEALRQSILKKAFGGHLIF